MGEKPELLSFVREAAKKRRSPPPAGPVSDYIEIIGGSLPEIVDEAEHRLLRGNFG